MRRRRLRDARSLLSTLQAQFAVVVTLVQVAEIGLLAGALEGSPHSVDAPASQRDDRNLASDIGKDRAGNAGSGRVVASLHRNRLEHYV